MLARCTAGGMLDTGFGLNGWVFTSGGQGYASYPGGATLQEDGKVVLAGTAQTGSSDLALRRAHRCGFPSPRAAEACRAVLYHLDMESGKFRPGVPDRRTTGLTPPLRGANQSHSGVEDPARYLPDSNSKWYYIAEESDAGAGGGFALAEFTETGGLSGRGSREGDSRAGGQRRGSGLAARG